VAAVKAQTAAIEADTQDLQTQIGVDGAGLTNIPTVAAVTTVTNLTNLPTIPTDWLTAAGVKADAVTKIQDGLSKPGTAQTITAPADMALNSTVAKDATVFKAASYTAPDNASIADILTDTGTTIPAQISGLNNLSAAQVTAAVPTASQNAAAVITAAETTPVEANVKQFNDVPLLGDGKDPKFGVE
jgi:hypothetical protein